MTPGPFSASAELGLARLRPLAPEHCASLAEAIVAMPPWSAMPYTAEGMARFLATENGGARRYVIEVDGAPAGAASVRWPWLIGPYLELLALLPAFQGQGIGGAFLGWFEAEAQRHGMRNLWACASSLNSRAVRFYARHGFVEAAPLPGLVADGFDEILLRKSPLGRPQG